MSNPFQGDETNLEDILGNMPNQQAKVIRKELDTLREALSAAHNLLNKYREQDSQHIELA